LKKQDLLTGYAAFLPFSPEHKFREYLTANPVNEITNISETAGPSWVTPVYSAVGNMTTLPQPADPTSVHV
jgi:hypothetical protein